MTDDQRDALINIAENSGLDPGDAEDMVDEYLEEIDRKQIADITKAKAKPPTPVGRNGTSAVKGSPKVKGVEEPVPGATPKRAVLSPQQERKRYPNYSNSLGDKMFLIPPETSILVNQFQVALPTKTRNYALHSPPFKFTP